MCPSVDRAENSPNLFPPIEIDPTVALTRPMTRMAYAYWQSVRADRAMPMRKDLSPQAMRAFLRHVALIEIRAGDDGRMDYVMRLAGVRIEDIFGPVTGRALGQFLPPQIETRWRFALDKAVEARAPLRAASRLTFAGKTWLQAEVLLAPLGEAGKVSMLLGALEVWPVAQMATAACLPA
jgi:hypothetical protein